MNIKLTINGFEVDALFTRRELEDLFKPLLRKLTTLQKQSGSETD